MTGCPTIRALAIAILGSCTLAAPRDLMAQPNSPEIFGEGILSTEAPEFGTTLTLDGRTVYFNRASADRSTLAIMRSRMVNGMWQTPDTASFSGTWRDLDPFVTPDGTRLYFSSNRPTQPDDSVLDFNTWVVALSPEEDTPGLLPPPLNSDSAEVFVSASASGALYFSSNRDGVMRSYRASTSGTDAKVSVVPIAMNLAGGVGNPAISPDESRLVFVAVSETGIGGGDLYMTSATDVGWSAPRLLPEPINSSFLDFAPSWSADGKYLYFTSERPGVVGPLDKNVRPPGDLYRVGVEMLGAP